MGTPVMHPYELDGNAEMGKTLLPNVFSCFPVASPGLTGDAFVILLLNPSQCRLFPSFSTLQA